MKAEIGGYSFPAERLVPLLLEMEVRNQALLETILSWMCIDRLGEDESYETILDAMMGEASCRMEELVARLYERHGSVNIRNILDGEGRCPE